MNGRRIVVTLLGVALLLTTGSATAPARPAPDSYTMTVLPGLEAGTADAINNRGQVAGTLPADSGPSGCATAVLWADGVVHPVDVDGDPGCVTVNDLNHHGEVVGNYHFPYDAYHWRRGETALLTGWGYYHEANAVSDRGLVAGGYLDEGLAGGPRAMLWDGGEGTDLGTLQVAPGDYQTYSASGATGINRRQQVVGWSSTDGGTRAFLWEQGTMTDLGTLGGNRSSPVDINHHGAVVGTSTTDDGSTRAFLWADGAIADLGAWTPVAINRHGVVVGNRDGHVVAWQGGRLIEVGAGAATDVNDAGEIVGTGADGTPVMWHR